MLTLASAAAGLRGLSPDRRYGRVVAVRGALIEVEGLAGAAQIGSRLSVSAPGGMVDAEVTGLDRGIAHCLPFSDPQGIASGARAGLAAGQFTLRPSSAWLGRMIDGLRVVESGLSPGDAVIVSGLQKVFMPGMPVAPKKVAMPSAQSAERVASTQ